MWHVSSRSGVATLRTAIHLLLTYLLTVSCFSKIQIGFTFLVPVHPGSPGKRAVERVCVGPSAQCSPSSRSSTSVGVCACVQAQVMAMLYGDRASVVVGRVRLSVCVCVCAGAGDGHVVRRPSESLPQRTDGHAASQLCAATTIGRPNDP